MESIGGGVKADKALACRDRVQQSLFSRGGHGRRAVLGGAGQIPDGIESEGVILLEVAVEDPPVIGTLDVEPAAAGPSRSGSFRNTLGSVPRCFTTECSTPALRVK